MLRVLGSAIGGNTLLLTLLVATQASCGGEAASNDPANSAKSGSGGMSSGSGASASGGKSNGGTSSTVGGKSNGGTSSTVGGNSNGGTASASGGKSGGGTASASGGKSNGGTASTVGGNSNGGSSSSNASGGQPVGGAAGSAASGASTGGGNVAADGGAAAAGSPGTGGIANAGAAGIVSAGAAGLSQAGSGNAGAPTLGGTSGCTCDGPGCGICPADHSVPIEAGTNSYRIDATEVTNQDYAGFLAANAALAAQPPACAWNGSYVPPNSWPATGMETMPVVWVDWCDAYAYCKWAKKRLCGQIGGGELAYASTRDPASSQWYRACSNNGTLSYPYGTTYDAQRCNGKDRVATDAGALPVGSQPGCEGGVLGLFDMSGNVWEWEDSCAGTVGATDSCRLRGGSFWSETSLMDCPTATESYTRASINKNIGFRCCSAP